MIEEAEKDYREFFREYFGNPESQFKSSSTTIDQWNKMFDKIFGVEKPVRVYEGSYVENFVCFPTPMFQICG